MRWYAISFAVFLLIATAVFMTLPVLPGFRGMTHAGDRLWIDRKATPEQISLIRDHVAQAERQVSTELDSYQPHPQWQVCVTAECDQRFRLHARGLTWLDLIVQISARGFEDQGFYTHEAVHAELHDATGLVGGITGKLPVWLDEGVAVLISHAPIYPDNPQACATIRDIPTPETKEDFALLAGPAGENAPQAYLAAACATLAWIAEGNRIDDLSRQLRAGDQVSAK